MSEYHEKCGCGAEYHIVDPKTFFDCPGLAAFRLWHSACYPTRLAEALEEINAQRATVGSDGRVPFRDFTHLQRIARKALGAGAGGEGRG